MNAVLLALLFVVGCVSAGTMAEIKDTRSALEAARARVAELEGLLITTTDETTRARVEAALVEQKATVERLEDRLAALSARGSEEQAASRGEWIGVAIPALMALVGLGVKKTATALV